MFYRVCTVNMHCISLVGSMAVGLGLSGVGLVPVDESVEINLHLRPKCFLNIDDLQCGHLICIVFLC